MSVFIGTAGWSLPKASVARFAGVGSHLTRYASRFNAVEINSSFYKPHRRTTYERWRATTPADFRFSVKGPRTITHERRLGEVTELIAAFAEQVAGLGDKLGVLLVQLPPSLALEERLTDRFFQEFTRRLPVATACEPRHQSWFTPQTEELFRRHRIARVAADPAVCPSAAEPGGWPELVYYRWHGSPRKYYSEYASETIVDFAQRVGEMETSRNAWCIFDNTALGAATEHALELAQLLARQRTDQTPAEADTLDNIRTLRGAPPPRDLFSALE